MTTGQAKAAEELEDLIIECLNQKPLRVYRIVEVYKYCARTTTYFLIELSSVLPRMHLEGRIQFFSSLSDETTWRFASIHFDPLQASEVLQGPRQSSYDGTVLQGRVYAVQGETNSHGSYKDGQAGISVKVGVSMSSMTRPELYAMAVDAKALADLMAPSLVNSPFCATCSGLRYVGTPPDNYDNCPDCT